MATLTIPPQALDAMLSVFDPICELIGVSTKLPETTVESDGQVTLQIDDEELIRVYSAIGRVVAATVAAIQKELA